MPTGGERDNEILESGNRVSKMPIRCKNPVTHQNSRKRYGARGIAQSGIAGQGMRLRERHLTDDAERA